MVGTNVPQPVQRLRCCFAALLPFILACLFISPNAQSQQPAGIVAVRENGRMIYVNNENPAPAPAAKPEREARHSVLIYWSNTEHRWKPVPHATPVAMSAARSAAQEVAGYISTRPRSATSAITNPNYAAMARGYRVTSSQIDAAIEEAAARHMVDPNLVRAVIKVESNFNPSAVSNKGAMGLMQLMPYTARDLRVSNPFDPEQNVDAGVRHLRTLLDNFHGDVPLTLAAYNAGAGAVTRSGGVPPYAETRSYVKKITDLYQNSGGFMYGASQPIRMFRGPDGVLRISNTE